MAPRRPLLAVLSLLALALLGWRLLHLYSVPRPYDVLLPQTREFLTRAVALDSTALVQTGASAAAVQWALETGRRSPTVLHDLLHDLSVGAGRRVTEGELLVIFHGSSRGSCLNRPLAVTFTGSLEQARIQTISTDCGTRP
ncbi:MAG TPA: hypothetical protein VGQ69_02035 [Gemmatimonadales bacterium]|jgi:hypothetical protein|nr:hypothetical protein [Gemmatimonadales bacterium]HEV8598120.1 hypothetical protein [Gemmatimonadales bacterium]